METEARKGVKPQSDKFRSPFTPAVPRCFKEDQGLAHRSLANSVGAQLHAMRHVEWVREKGLKPVLTPITSAPEGDENFGTRLVWRGPSRRDRRALRSIRSRGFAGRVRAPISLRELPGRLGEWLRD